MSKRINVFSTFSEDNPRLLLLASTGGHLTQLSRFAEAAGIADHATWVTFRSPQSESLLRGKRVVWVDYIAPRDLRGTLKAYKTLEATLKPRDFDGVVSTGAAVAIAGFLWGRKHRLRTVYIESVSRTDGPSLTGRIAKGFRLASTYTQHKPWASDAWPLADSVLQGYRRVPANNAQDLNEPLRILVTFGTIRPYRFDRLIDQILKVTTPADTIVWQLGVTSRDDLPGDVHEFMSPESLLETARNSDVIVTHSGVGTILQLLDDGISPVVVPRRQNFDEHIDDHQLQIWQLLTDTDIAHPVEADELTRETLHASARHQTVREGSQR